MKTLLTILGILFSAHVAWACVDAEPGSGFKSVGGCAEGKWPLIVHKSSGLYWEYREWVVAKGSETFILDEFVSSGRFCAWRGKHEWQIRFHSFACMECDRRYYTCLICGRDRKMLKSSRAE